MPNLTPDDVVSLSTQYVGAGTGGTIPMLARVSLVNYRGQVIVDSYVSPTTYVSNWRTEATGITPETLAGAPTFENIQAFMATQIENKVLVGHEVGWSLSILGIAHTAADTRDVLLYKPFIEAMRGPARLATVTKTFLNRRIQYNGDDSLENARACIDLYRSIQGACEGYIDQNVWPFEVPPQKYARQFL